MLTVDPTRLTSDSQFRLLLIAFLDDLTIDERIDVRRDLNAALKGTATQAERDDIIEFYFRAMPGFNAFEMEWSRRPCWQRYSNVGRDTREDKAWRRLLVSRGCDVKAVQS